MTTYIPQGQYILNNDAAKILGVSNGMVAQYVRDGKLVSIVLKSGRKKLNLFLISEVERFQKENK